MFVVATQPVDLTGNIFKVLPSRDHCGTCNEPSLPHVLLQFHKPIKGAHKHVDAICCSLSPPPRLKRSDTTP